MHRTFWILAFVILEILIFAETAIAAKPIEFDVLTKPEKHLVILSALPPGRLRIIFSKKNSEDVRFVEFDPYLSPRTTIAILLEKGTWKVTSWADPIRDPGSFTNNYAWQMEDTDATSPSDPPLFKISDCEFIAETNIKTKTDKPEKLAICRLTSLDLHADSKSLATLANGGPPLSGRAFGSTATMVNDLLSTVAEVVVASARGRAANVLTDRLKELACEELKLPETQTDGGYKQLIESLKQLPGEADNLRLFPSACALVKSVRIEDLLGSGQNLLAAIQVDLATLTMRGLMAGVSTYRKGSPPTGAGTKALQLAMTQILGQFVLMLQQKQRGVHLTGSLDAQQLLMTIATQDLKPILDDANQRPEVKALLYGLQIAFATMQQCHKQSCDARMVKQVIENSLTMYADKIKFEPVSSQWLKLLQEKIAPIRAEANSSTVATNFLGQLKVDFEKYRDQLNEISIQVDNLQSICNENGKSERKVVLAFIKQSLTNQNTNLLGIINNKINQHLSSDRQIQGNIISSFQQRIDTAIRTAMDAPKIDDKICTTLKNSAKDVTELEELLAESKKFVADFNVFQEEISRELFSSTSATAITKITNQTFIQTIIQNAIHREWPDLDGFVQRGLLVLAPPKGASSAEQLALVVDLLFDIADKLSKHSDVGPHVPKLLLFSRRLILGAVRSDLQSMLTAAAELVPVVMMLASNTNSSEEFAERFGRAARILAAAGAYLSSYVGTEQMNAEQLKVQQQARKRAIESLIDDATRRRGRGGKWIVSIGASAGMTVGYQYSSEKIPTFSTSNPSQSTSSRIWTSTAVPPQLALPIGFSVQRLPGAGPWGGKYLGFHSQLTIIDIAQYLSYDATSTKLQPSWSSALAIGGQVGMLIGIPRALHTPFIIGVDARYSPTLYQPSPDLPATNAIRIGGFVGVYVPFFDFN